MYWTLPRLLYGLVSALSVLAFLILAAVLTFIDQFTHGYRLLVSFMFSLFHPSARKDIRNMNRFTIGRRSVLQKYRCTLPPRYDPLIRQLEKDGFNSSRLVAVEADGRRAFSIPQGSSEKYLYYLEGRPAQAGFLMGILAPDNILAMSREYSNNVIFSTFGLKKWPSFRKVVGNLLTELVFLRSAVSMHNIPWELSEEMYGMYRGARKSRPVLFRDLVALNYGVDTILSYVYDVAGFLGLQYRLEEYQDPLSCNSFAAQGTMTQNGHMLFGRDFMFSTCDVFNRTGAYLLYNQEGSAPYLGFGAPGFAGSVVGLNPYGLSMGVHLAAGGNVRRGVPGLNSLLLVRHALQNNRSLPDLVECISRDNRGVSYLYPAAQGDVHPDFAEVPQTVEGNHGAAPAGKLSPRYNYPSACVMETGDCFQKRDFFEYLPPRLLNEEGCLPDPADLDSYDLQRPFRRGMVVRWMNDEPVELNLESQNRNLFRLFGLEYQPEMNQPGGMFVSSRDIRRIHLSPGHEKDYIVPSVFFFPGERILPDCIMVSNHYISPQMRLLSMNAWIGELQHIQKNDAESQYRYDLLNQKFWKQRAESSKLDFTSARQMIDYLNPFEKSYASHPQDDEYLRNSDGSYARSESYDFYGSKYTAKHGTPLTEPSQLEINGSISILDLTDLKFSSIWGFYNDSWVQVDFSAILSALKHLG